MLCEKKSAHTQQLSKPSNYVKKQKWLFVKWGSETLATWSRTQQSGSLNFAEAEFYAWTTGVAEGQVTKHLLREFGHEQCWQSLFRSMGKSRLGNVKHVILKCMYVQDVVEKKLTNIARTPAWTGILVLCHLRSSHPQPSHCVDINNRLKQNRKRDEDQTKIRNREKFINRYEKASDQNKMSRHQGRLQR